MGRKVGDLKANPKNPRVITDAKLKQLEKSMREFGDLSGIFYNRRTGNIGGGTQRTSRFTKDTPITITKSYDKPTKAGTLAYGYILLDGERFSYREVDWSLEKELAANIAANKQAGSWNEELLGDTLKHLASFDVDFDMSLTMFDPKELIPYGAADAHTVAEHERLNPTTGVDEDEVPEVPSPKTKLGDLYILGEHRLLCGDCTVKENVERLMGGEKADMVFTDPPYGMKLDTDFSGMMAGGEAHWKKHATSKTYRKVEGDFEDFDPSFILSTFEGCQEIFLWGADYYAERLKGKNEGSWVVWDKRENEEKGNYNTEGMDRRFGSQFEICWSKFKHRREIARVLWTGLFGTQHEDIKKRQHPTQKPIALAEWFFERWGKDATNIWDGYLGSGSTLIACEKTGRRCFGMEIDPHYCDVIVSRWEKYTGKKATLQKTVTRKKSVHTG